MQVPQYTGEALSAYHRFTQPGAPFHLWHYVYKQVPLISNLDTINKLTEQGFEQVEGRDNAERGAVLAYLFGQLQDVVWVRDGTTSNAWAHNKAIEHVKRCPVLLCFTLEGEPQPEEEHIQMLQFLPLPRHGEFAIVREEDEIAVYSSHDLGEDGIALKKKLAEAIKELAGSSEWGNHTPVHTFCNLELNYISVYTHLLSEMVASHGKARKEAQEHFHKLEKAHRDVVALRQSWLRPDWLVQWSEIRRMAQELATTYYEHHIAQLHQKAQEEANKRNLPVVSDAFANEQAKILTALPYQAFGEAMSNAASGGKGFVGEQTGETSYRATYTKKSPSGTTSIHAISPPDEKSIEVARERVWQQVQKYGDLDGDVFLAIVAQLINTEHARDEKGWTWVLADHILDYRGIRRKSEITTLGKAYSAGHRTEDREDIAKCVARMQYTRVTVDQVIYMEPAPGSKRKTKQVRYKSESPLFLFGQFITRQELWSYADGGHPTMEVAWKVKESEWMEPFINGTNRMVGTLMQSCLEYDPRNQKWEKRISKYLMFHLAMNKHHSSITRNINAMLEELSLSEEINTRDPIRTKDRFEKALNRLRADGHISGWQYKNEVDLPARKWLSTWLAQDVEFTKTVVIDEIGDQEPDVR